MKHIRPLLWIAVALALCAWGAGYYLRTSSTHAMMNSEGHGEMEWLRKQYKLTPVQFEKIKKMHEDYRPMCDSMCDRVRDSQKKLSILISQNREITPEIKKAIQENSILLELSQNTLLEHVYRVSREMNPKQAEAYIAMMRPHIIELGAQPASLK